MKGLAELVMRGRLQALLVVVAGAGSLLFCWISAAALALVTLRKGAGAGLWLFMWALLPAGTLVYAFGDSGPLTLLAGTMVLALVLRNTINLPLAVLSAVGVGAVTGLALMAFAGAYLDQMVAYFSEFLASLEQQLSQGGEVMELPRPDAPQIAGMLGAGTATMSVLCLLLARYWQAALYNVGGFSVEFKALYYPATVTSLLLVAAVGLYSLGLQYRTWAMICLIPLTFAGLSLLHARAEMRGRGTGWLTGFYIAWLIFDPVKLLVVLFAVADSWMNFRQRWSKGPGNELSRRDDDDGAGDENNDQNNDRDN
ncbi:Uncharacterised protein [Halioglobus japonicus]|nr:Uncharacterised protein [Halioglobus japonicus]